MRYYLSTGTSVLDAKAWTRVLEHGSGEQGIHTGSSGIGDIQGEEQTSNVNEHM